MKVKHSLDRPAKLPDAAVAEILRGVSPERLRALVQRLAFPRHYVAEGSANRRARDLLLKSARSIGYAPFLQGSFDNIVMMSGDPGTGPSLLLGAHYDSVPGSPGADDNASAVAVCLECARLIRRHNVGSVMIVLFNREEDGLLGSSEFVDHLVHQTDWSIAEAHIFEMVGYRDRAAGSQTLPARLPIRNRDVGDFLALLANAASKQIAEQLLTLAASYIPQSIVVALKLYLGIEKLFGDLNRSDHAPFWQAGIPSIMWTDTSEFRNPHYHLASDTPSTLDYDFMGDVAKLALARVVSGDWENLPSRRR
jgi:Zn-dependent M28 family amino/carboxypeptidase